MPPPSVGGSQSVGGSSPSVVVVPSHGVPDAGSPPVSNRSAFPPDQSPLGSASQLDASPVGHASSIPAPSTIQGLLTDFGLGPVIGLVMDYAGGVPESMTVGLQTLVAGSLMERNPNPYTRETQRLETFLDIEHGAYTAVQSMPDSLKIRFEHLKMDTGGAGGDRLREAAVAIHFEGHVGGLARPMTGQLGDFIGTSGPFKGVSFDHMGMEAGENQSTPQKFIKSAINHTNKEGVHFVLLDFEYVPKALQEETLRAINNEPISDERLAKIIAADKKLSGADLSTGIVIYRGPEQIEWHRPCTKQLPSDDGLGFPPDNDDDY